MTCLCITGSSVNVLSKVEAHLHSMGVDRLNTAKLGDHLSMTGWHDQLVNTLITSETTLPLVSQPGIRWDLLAANILGNNLETRLFGWQDTRSLQALDYWHNFDKNIRFILVTTSAEQVLLEAMTVSNEVFQSEPILRKWRQQHEAMLRFYYRHMNDCVLVDAEYCLKNLNAFKLHLERKFNVELISSSLAQSDNIAYTAIQRFFTTRVLQNSPETLSLQNEIEQSALRFDLADWNPVVARAETSIDSLINEYCLDRITYQVLLAKQVHERSAAKLKVEELKTEGESYLKLYHETQYKNIILYSRYYLPS